MRPAVSRVRVLKLTRLSPRVSLARSLTRTLALPALLARLCAAVDLDFDAVQALTVGENPKSIGFMRLNHYTKHAGDAGMNIHVCIEIHPDAWPRFSHLCCAPRSLVCQEHTDAGLFTILWASDVCGLQYQDQQGGWERATQADDGTLTLTINVGDQFQVLSNGAVRAPVHRVVCEPGCPLPRYSIALFFNPSETAVISPMTKQVSDGRENRLYRDIPWAEFRRRRFDGDAADIGREIQISDYLL